MEAGVMIGCVDSDVVALLEELEASERAAG